MKLKGFNIVLICLIFLSPYFLMATNTINTSLYVLSVNDGLSQQDVEACTQDKYGFLWFCTYDGLNRFDGLNFKVFRHNPADHNSITSNRLISLCSNDSILWIGTEYNSIIKYNMNNDIFTDVRKIKYSDVNLKKINNISVGYDNNIIIASSSGLFLMDDDCEIHQIDTCSVNNVLTCKDKLYLCTDDGLKIYVKSGEDYLFNNHILKNKEVNQLKLMSDGQKMMVCASNELLVIDIDCNILQSIEFENKVVDVIEWVDNNILILTTRELYLYDNKDKYKFENNFFSNNLLKKIFLDRENNVWILSGNKGIAKMSENSAVFNKLIINNSELFVKSYLKTNDCYHFVGTKENGLFIISKNREQINLLKKEFVTKIFEDTFGKIWICSNGIFYKYDTFLHSLERLDKIPNFPKGYSYHGMDIVEDSLKNLWIAQNSGLLRITRLHNGDYLYKMFPYNEVKQFVDFPITSLVFDNKRNCFWAATQGRGLYKFFILNGQIYSRNYCKANTSSLSSDLIWCLKLDNNTLYVGTDIGLNKLNCKDVLEKYDMEVLSTPKIMAINISRDSTLWLNTSQGLLSYNYNKNAISHYDYINGLLSNTFSEASFLLNDTLYVGNIYGVNYFNTLKIKKNVVPPLIAIDDIKIMGESIEKNDLKNNTLVLKYNRNSILIDVKAIHFENPFTNYISYYLKGNDDLWTTTLNNQIIYNNIPIGNYSLLIKASNSDGVWSDVYSFHIKILPPFWRTWWAYTIYFVLLVLILYVTKVRYEQKRKRILAFHLERLKYKSDVEIAEHKIRFHTDLMHEIRTPLTLIAGPLYEMYTSIRNDKELKSKLTVINKNVSYLLRCVNDTLDLQKIVDGEYKLKVNYYNVDTTIQNVIGLFTLALKHKNININIINEVSDSEQTIYDNDIISNILINIVNNAVKHTPVNGEIIIHSYINNDNLIVNVDDSGKGIDVNEIDNIFNRYFQSRKNKVKGTGLGLALAKQLIEIHKGEIKATNLINGGASFSIRFPIAPYSYSETEICNNIDLSLYNDFHIFDDDSLLEMLTEKNISNIKILIVDENVDFLNYVSDIFSKYYSVIAKNDINEGFDYAMKNLPDIIITDIRLGNSNLDGIELIKKIKSYNETKHIPIIVLSSYSSQEDIINGLVNGADDYIIKPCYPDILLLKVKNILRNSKKVIFAENNISSDSNKDYFLKTVKDLILNEMTNPNFSIDYICNILHISRMQMHRKMLNYTGESTSNFIRNIRFNEAYRLLSETEMNVSEVMYNIGLTNLSSFTVTFFKKFNVLPSDVKRYKCD